MSRVTRSATQPSPEPSLRAQRFQNSISYKEPDSDDDDFEEFAQFEVRPRNTSTRTVTRPRRNPKRLQTPVTPVPIVKTSRKAPKRRGSTSSTSGTDVTKLSASIERYFNSISREVTPSIVEPSAGPTLPWESLEYGILLNIFSYAAGMLEKDGRDSNNWLVKASKTCKAFYEPAISALYRESFLDRPELRGYLTALKSTDNTGHWGRKVKHLQLEAHPALTRKAQDALTLQDILASTPNIEKLALEVYHDRPASKSLILGSNIRFTHKVYQPEMIGVMEQNAVRLKSMKWNYLLNLNQEWPWNALEKIHSTSPMQSLEKLDIVWLNAFNKSKNIEKDTQSFIDGLHMLPNLKELNFVSSELFVSQNSILDRLPRQLKAISFIDCDKLTSTDLTAFLATHGSALVSLTVKHIRTLNLEFTESLASNCPNLESFTYDLRCYSSLSSSKDGDPTFIFLLPPGIVPSWPTKLRHIELLWIRKWERDAAEGFFQSLVDSARNLRDLRYLAIKTTVDMDWRQRTDFKQEWVSRLHTVFGRKVAPPVQPRRGTYNRKIIGSTSKSAFQEATSRKRKANTNDDKGDCIARRLRRRTSSSEDEKTSGALRQALGVNVSSKDKKLFIQGLCDKVYVRIENIRPTETQYSEADFMDDEAAGDADWNGRDLGDADGLA